MVKEIPKQRDKILRRVIFDDHVLNHQIPQQVRFKPNNSTIYHLSCMSIYTIVHLLGFSLLMRKFVCFNLYSFLCEIENNFYVLLNRLSLSHYFGDLAMNLANRFEREIFPSSP